MSQKAASTQDNFIWQDIHDQFYDETNPVEGVFDEMVARQVELGDALDKPCETAQELLDVFTIDDAPCLQHWLEAVDRFGNTSNVVDISEPLTREHELNEASRRQAGERVEDGVIEDVSSDDDNEDIWNDALIIGKDHPDMKTLLQKSFVGMIGNIDPDDARNNTADGKWARTELPLFQWLEGWKKGQPLENSTIASRAFGLTRYKYAKKKGGDTIMFADAADGSRKDGAIRAFQVIGLDVDSGTELPDTLDALVEENVFALVYPSFRHLTTELELDHDTIVTKLRLSDTPSLEDVRTYLRDHHKDRYSDDFIDAVEIAEACRETTKKQLTILKTPPQHKFRIFLFLWETVEVKSLGVTLAERKAVWAAKVQGVANMLGIEIDKTCCDLNRALFLPQLLPGSKLPMYLVQGCPLRYGEIPVSETAKAGGKKFNRRPDVVTKDGLDVSALYDRYGKRWMIADICEYNDITSTAPVSNGGGKWHVPCPFADGHTDSSDKGSTCVWNAEDAQNGFAVGKCQHASCAERHLVDFLGAWIDNGDLNPAALEDPDDMTPLGEDQEEAKFFRLTPDETLGEAEAHAYLRDHLETVDGKTQITDGALEQATDLLVNMGVSDTVARQRVDDAKSDVERQIAERVADRKMDPVSNARVEAAGDVAIPHVLVALYDENLVDDDGFILKPDVAPKLYRAYGIKIKDEDAAYKLMRLEIRDQIYRNLSERFNYVVLDGEAKLAINQIHGEGIKLWKEQTMGKLYVNRCAHYWDESGPSPKVKTIKPAEVFITARQRETFFDTCFEPDPVKAEARARHGAFNLWNGFAVVGKKGNWSNLRNHIKDNICNGDEEIFNFVMTWLASIFARPGTKIPSSLAVIGEQGVGKSKVFDWIRSAIGSAALKVSAERHLVGNFNAHLDALIFLVCEEAFWGGDKKSSGVMKDLISSTTLQIEGKFENLVERPNYVNIVFVSNNKWSVPVDGEDARRFLVLECADTQKQNAKYFGAIDDQMENGGLEAMVYELMNWNPKTVGLTWHSLRNPPVTDSLRQQVGMGLSGPAERMVSILESGILSGRAEDGDVFYYDLADDESTPVARNHLVAALETKKGLGNLSHEMKDAIITFLGKDADHGDNKIQIDFLGDLDPKTDVRRERSTQDRTRYVTFPALNDVKDILTRFGRG